MAILNGLGSSANNLGVMYMSGTTHINKNSIQAEKLFLFAYLKKDR